MGSFLSVPCEVKAMDDALLIEVFIDMQVELKALQDCLLLDVEIPLLTIQGRREDAMLNREDFRQDVLKRLGELRLLAANAP
jgi:hypothetical protein